MNTIREPVDRFAEQDPKPFQYDLGILLVHGIGEQKRGEALQHVGDVLCSWIIRWTTHDNYRKRSALDPNLGNTDICIRKTALAKTEIAHEEPAHSELIIKIPSEAGQADQVWLLAESWWASSINPPTFLDFFKWACLIVPWVISTSFVQLCRRGKVLSTVGFVVSPLFSFLLMGLMLILAIVSIVPKFRPFVIGTQRLASGILGDIFLYTESNVSRSSILTQVLKDMTWVVKQRCKKVIVIAHSQGAAITYDLLTELVSKGMVSLITYGSAIYKLNQFESLKPEAMAKIGYLPILGLFIFCLSVWLWPSESFPTLLLTLVHAYIINTTFRDLMRMPPLKPSFPERIGSATNTFLSLFVTAYLFILTTQNFYNLTLNYLACLPYIWSFYVFSLSSPLELLSRKLPTAGRYTWTDFYASADLVPNGPILEGEQNFIEVYNRDSWLFDHVTYWKSPDDFVWRIVRLLFHKADLGTHPLRPDADLKFCTDYVLSRKRRVVSLKRCRYFLGLISAVCMLVLARKIPSEETSFLYQIAAKLKPYLSYLFETAISESVSAGLVFLGFIASVYLLLLLYWNIWDKFTQASFFARKPLNGYHEYLFRLFFWSISIFFAIMITKSVFHNLELYPWSVS